MKSSCMKFVMACVVILLGISTAVAEPVFPKWDIDFDLDTAGQPPAYKSPSAGIINTNPSALAVGDDCNILVQDDYQDTVTSNSFGAGSMVVVLTDQSYSTNVPANQSCTLRLYANNNDNFDSGIMDIEYDTMTDSSIIANGFLSIKSSANKTVLSIICGGSTRRINVDERNNAGAFTQTVSSPTGSLPRGTISHIRARIDLENKTVAIYINGTLGVTAALPPDGANTINIDNMYFNTGSSSGLIWALDNIKTTWVPAGTVIVVE